MTDNDDEVNDTDQPPVPSAGVGTSTSNNPITVHLQPLSRSQSRAMFNARNTMQCHNSCPLPYAARPCMEYYHAAPWHEVRTHRNMTTIDFDVPNLSYVGSRPITGLF